MPRRKKSALAVVAKGFRGTVRAGKYPDPYEAEPDKAGGPIQFRLTLEMPNQLPEHRELAEECWTRLMQMRDALVKSKRGLEAEQLLRDAARHVTEPALFETALHVASLVPDLVAPVETGQWRTWGDLADAWTSGRLKAKYPHKKIPPVKDVKKNEGIVEWLQPFIGKVPLETFAVEHYNIGMGNLPARVKSPAAARHYHQVIMRVMRLAKKVKLISAWKLEDVETITVEKKDRPTFTCLFPKDLGALLPCVDIDLRWRTLWGFMTYESPRIGKLREVRWHHIERDGNGAIKMDSKSGEILYWDLRPGTLDALEKLRQLYPALEGPFSWMSDTDIQRAAETLREHLLLAGVDDPRLHETKGRFRRLRAHDTRATFVVFAKLEGRSEGWIMDRTGHTTSEMVQRYDRLCRVAIGKGWKPLGRLDDALGLGAVAPSPPTPPTGPREHAAVQVSDRIGPDAVTGGRDTPGGASAPLAASGNAANPERAEAERAEAERGAVTASVTVGVTPGVLHEGGLAGEEAEVVETISAHDWESRFRRLDSNQNQRIQRPLNAGESTQNTGQDTGCDTQEGSGSDEVSHPTVTPRAAYAAALKRAMHAAIECEAFADVGHLSTLFAAATEAAGGAAVVELALRRRGRTG